MKFKMLPFTSFASQTKRAFLFLAPILVLSGIRVEATTYTVKGGGGGNYTTIGACITAMSSSGGDTCQVFAGTYNETPTLKAGTSGNYNTLTVNSGDTVNVLGFAAASHTKIIGFVITNPSAPSSAPCVEITGFTDVYITNNTMTQCGGGGHIASMIHGDYPANGTSNIYIQGNTLSYACDTPSAPNTCTPMEINGTSMLIENNDISHGADSIEWYGDHVIIRGNTIHDLNSSECGSHSGNCHIDGPESEPATSQQPATNNILIEGNTVLRNEGNGGNNHGYLLQADACSGSCHNAILRYNIIARMGSDSGNGYGLIADNAGNCSVPGFTYIKEYNNTDVNVGAGSSNNDTTDSFACNSSNGSVINSIYYYTISSMTANAYYRDSSSSAGWLSKNNDAFCTGSCTFYGESYGTGSFTSVSGNISSDPKFVSMSSDNYHLSAGSPAIGTGSYLTTASGSGSNSTSLTVADASFFQDGLGLNSVGVQADWIRIGSAATAQISSINYSTNVITLASPGTWNSGDGIYLYKDSKGNVVLSGKNPDIGAYPSGGQAQTPPSPPTTLQAVVN